MLPNQRSRPSPATRPSPGTRGAPHRRLPRARTAVVVASTCAATAIAGSAAVAVAHGAADPASTATRTIRATVRPANEPRISTGRMLVQLPWGTATGEVGLETPGQGLARGPEALAVAPDGRIAILDGVNRRLVLLDPSGEPAGAIPVPLASPRFLTVDDQHLYVADADSDRRVRAWDWQGQALGEQPLPSVDAPVTGLLLRGQQLLVETGHDQTYPLDLAAADPAAAGTPPESPADSPAANTSPNADTSANAPADAGPALTPSKSSAPPTATQSGDRGRPLDRDGAHTAEAERTPQGPVHVRLRDRADPGTLTDLELTLPEPTEHIVSLDGDDDGDVVVGVRLLRRGGAAPPAPLAVTRIPGGDRSATQTILLRDLSMVYVGQPYTVAPDGRVYQPIATPAGYRIVVHEFPRGVTR